MKRAMMKFVQKNMAANTNVIGMEIGVNYGDNALDMLESMPNIGLLNLVDPYEVYDGLYSNLLDAQDSARAKLNKFNNKIKWNIKRFEDYSGDEFSGLDFVYIDGNHTYDYVKKDIEIAIQMVKTGGIIGGHDFNDTNIYGITEAVNEYVKENNLELFFADNGDVGIDWWFIKK